MPLPLGALPPWLKHQCPPPLPEALNALFSSHFALQSLYNCTKPPRGKASCWKGPCPPPPARKLPVSLSTHPCPYWHKPYPSVCICCFTPTQPCCGTALCTSESTLRTGSLRCDCCCQHKTVGASSLGDGPHMPHTATTSGTTCL